MTDEPGWHSKRGTSPRRGVGSPELLAAREQAAALYSEGSIARVGILGGQWDNGNVVQQFIIPPTKV